MNIGYISYVYTDSTNEYNNCLNFNCIICRLLKYCNPLHKWKNYNPALSDALRSDEKPSAF